MEARIENPAMTAQGVTKAMYMLRASVAKSASILGQR
jgi:hypothetical protein